jgi:hypothetical protein
MKKYMLIVTLFFTGCNGSSPKTYVCINPFMSLQGIQVETGIPSAKDVGQFIELTDENGAVLVMPKSLCAEVRNIKQ